MRSAMMVHRAKAGRIGGELSIADLHTELEEALEASYGIDEVIVVDADADGASPLAALGAAAADYLENTLRPTDVLGISSWSATLLNTVNTMRTGGRAAAREVVQMVGGRGNPQVQLLATTMLQRFGQVLGAEPVFMLTPAVLGSAQSRNDLLADPSLAAVVRAWQRLTVSLVGIGALDPSPMLAESGNVQLETERIQLAEAHAVGDVCLHYFDAAGRLIRGGFEDHVMAIGDQQLKAVPRRIGVAGGLGKLAAVRGSLLGGWINVLITDSALATRLLEQPSDH